MNDKTVLITGGTSGIGLAMAKLFAAMGNTVIVCGRTSEKCNSVSRENPGLVAVTCDVTCNGDRLRLRSEIESRFGHLDMLVNNAGGVHRFLIERCDNLEEVITEEWRINYMAPVLMSRLFLPILARSRGLIVNVNSALAHVPIYIEPDYCATKAALHSMSRSMRIQLKDQGINVTEVFFPAVDTPFQQGHAPKNAISPELAAREAFRGIMKGKSEVHVKMAKLFYVLNRIMPRSALRLLTAIIRKSYKDELGSTGMS